MEHNICKNINKAAYLHKRLMSKLLERFSITFAQHQVLDVIQKHPGVTAKEILIYLDTDKATLSGVLNRLEKAFLVERIPNDDDRRLMHIHLTEKSRLLCSEIAQLNKTCEIDLIKGLRPKEIRFFNDVFTKVIENQKKKNHITIK